LVDVARLAARCESCRDAARLAARCESCRDAARLAARCESCRDAARLAARCYKFSKTFSKTIDRAGIKLPAAGILQITVCKEVLEDAGFKRK